MSSRLRSALLAGGLFALTAPVLLPMSALAQERAGPPTAEGWSFRLGGGAIVAPDYEGSDDYEIQPVPDVEVTYSDWFFFNREGLGVNLLTGGPLVAGIAVSPNGGRDQDENSALRGLGDIDATAEGKVFARYTIDRFTLAADLSGDILGEGHEGMTASLSATYMLMPMDNLLVFVGPTVTWADDDYMQSYFGVTAAQARTSGYRAYSAGSGIKDVGVSMFFVSQVSDHWVMSGLVGYSRLMEDAADSPLVAQQGDRDQYIGGLFLSYQF
ncbi:MAG: hypothetical protein RLY86_3100 [Pseudomonadota bacterium]